VSLIDIKTAILIRVNTHEIRLIFSQRSRKLSIADSTKGDIAMPNRVDHLKVLEKKITALSDALAHLGKGADLRDLIEIIRFPG
jgi:hypothetical protein